MSSPFFRFKQFQVWHDQCAMKVGTDGVLLGAWCPLPSRECVHVLDIGTGSGLIALMMAQRTCAVDSLQLIVNIDAIDIDGGAVEQAAYNFKQSPWAENLHAYQSSLQEWHSETKYDLIMSNPPYFQASLKNPDSQRATARHTDTLSYCELLAHASRLLTADGTIALILPADAEQEIVTLAHEYALAVTRLTYVHSKPGKPVKRILIAFTPSTTALPATQVAHFYIESDTAPRSEEYQTLTHEFYL